MSDRRNFIRAMGGVLSLPLLDSLRPKKRDNSPTRFLVVGNPLGMHPANFFPPQFGNDYEISPTLKSLDWLKDRLTILSHTDHGMNNGHGREISFLNGILPAQSSAFPEKSISVDQVMARQLTGRVRFPYIGAALSRGIRMSWTANGTELEPFTDPHELFNHLFLNQMAKQKKTRKEMLKRNESILDTARQQYRQIRNDSGKADRDRIDQYEHSVRQLEKSLSDRAT